MSVDAETFVKQCVGCLHSDKSRSTKQIPVGSFPVPDTPGQLYNLDIAGPFFNGHYLVVLIDATSNFPEVLDTKDITSSKIIKWLRTVWSRVGLPAGVITDNGPQFVSTEFEDFLKSLDIHHHCTPVYYPQENGRVEVFNRTIKHGIQAAVAGGTAWEEGVHRLIQSFRHTPGPDDKTPAEKFLGRATRRPGEVNLCAPQRLVLNRSDDADPAVHYAGTDAPLKKGLLRVGDQVLVRRPQVLKGQPPFMGPLEVKEVISYFKFLLSDGKVYNARRLKLFRRRTVQTQSLDEVSLHGHNNQAEPANGNQEASSDAETSPPQPRRSERANKGVPPQRYTPSPHRRRN